MTPPKLSEVNGWVNNFIHHHSPNERDGMNVPGGVMGVVMHTMVGNLPGTDQEFDNAASQLSAHFGVGQDGTIIQWVSIRGGIAWAEMGGNDRWYSIEHADNKNPDNPLTQAQLNSSAQLLELLSRVGNFPLQEANSPSEEGYGVHSMGGSAWGGHTPVPVDRTEFLTYDGWKYFDDLTSGDQVASWSADSGVIDFSPLCRKTEVFRSDTVVRGGIETSPDHRFHVRDNRRPDVYKAVRAEDLTAHHQIPLAGRYAGSGLDLSDDMIRLLVAVQADGRVLRSEHGQRMPKGVEFHYRKARKIVSTLGLLDRLGLNYSRSDRLDGSTVIRVYDARWVQTVVAQWLPGKSFSWAWLELDERQFGEFRHALMRADGCVSVNKYATTDQRSADVVMALHALHGYRANRDAQGLVCFGRTAKAGQEIPHANAMSAFGVTPRNDVAVACITTDNDSIIVRQDKRRVAILGNCPDEPPNHVRSRQRPAIIALAKQIRGGSTPPPPRPPAPPVVKTWGTVGMLTLSELASVKLHEEVSTVLRITAENSPGGVFAANLAEYVNAVFAGDQDRCPAGVTWYWPVAGTGTPRKWTTAGMLSLSALAAQEHVTVADVLASTVRNSPGQMFPPANATYINRVFGRSDLKVPAGVEVHYHSTQF